MLPDARLDWLSCSYQSRFGMIRSEWKKQDDQKNNSRGFRVGASGNENQPKTDDDALAAIFGNNLK